MLTCVDVGYGKRDALAALVGFARWEDAEPAVERTVRVAEVAPYVPGEFYRRELPCILRVLETLDARPECVVVDGFVWLDAMGRKGLGAHLHDALGSAVPVIGVAKTAFAPSTAAVPVMRGDSKRPLLVTSVGMDAQEAAACITRMHGKHRIPTLLKRVDALSRSSGTRS